MPRQVEAIQAQVRVEAEIILVPIVRRGTARHEEATIAQTQALEAQIVLTLLVIPADQDRIVQVPEAVPGLIVQVPAADQAVVHSLPAEVVAAEVAEEAVAAEEAVVQEVEAEETSLSRLF